LTADLNGAYISRSGDEEVKMMCRNPLQCIVPPHVLDQIARRGSPEQRDWALDTIHHDHSLRAARLQAVLTTPPRQRAVDALAPEPGTLRRTIYDAVETTQLPGTLVRAEGSDPTGDVAVDEAYDGLGATHALYWQIFRRDSIDDAGLALDGIVHYGQRYDNAFWDTQRMIFGDGDGELFKRFTIAVDVIGHELTHGVTQYTANLNYWQQPGALNESMSDVFGSLVKQYALGQSAEQADWLIGAGLLADAVQGEALRSMKAPGTAYDDPKLGKDPQPADMANYVQTTADNGGVHINSGIPNRAFYLLATNLGGNAWDKAGWIWYTALRDPQLQPTARFRTFAAATRRAAVRVYGQESTEEKALLDAWSQVGIEA
jgi:Zn-dependent metalloprotease